MLFGRIFRQIMLNEAMKLQCPDVFDDVADFEL